MSRSWRCRIRVAAAVGALVTAPSLAAGLTSSSRSDAPPAHDEPVNECVVLLHGLARTRRCMHRMAEALTAAGYTVHALDYASTRKTVERLAAEDLVPLVDRCQVDAPRKIHFVAHSIGNIVLRQYFATNVLANAGRIVMLGPPNHGSEVVDTLGRFAPFAWINGPAGRQLGTAENALPSQLPAPPVEVGVIAGTRSINLILSAMIPGRDDGKVAVERTKLEGMTDFATVATAHPFLMRNREVIQLTLTFLREGRFRQQPDRASRLGP